MASSDIKYGYEVNYELAGKSIFETIGIRKDDFLWDLNFRPAFTEEKYVRFDDRANIELTPPSNFSVYVKPNTKEYADETLEIIESLIDRIQEAISEPGQTERIKISLNYILVVNQEIDLNILLPSWYQKAANLPETNLREFKIYIIDIYEGVSRETEVVLSSKEEDLLEIIITSPNESLANSLVASICESQKGD